MSGPRDDATPPPEPGVAVTEACVRREDLLDTEYEPPDSELEARIAGVEAAVLGIDRVSRTDSFFELGGTSLHAVRICARIERTLGYRALPMWLIECDVLQAFAARIASEGMGVDG
ncbi:hypothetical protein FHG89_11520 [Micromonospora orduensis]|uniref:Carrier domain-containing protein n=1 Tax=Micromonospora orduensis TaxID=1420891 RepID=A0A5C4QTC7_9ACTN|nr:phosphopantetheine-binding protein [Micromonospora orduensis]TNH29629.1 hypothetical protein FHG89_11520 [Micromonospora orduensis]